MRFGQFRKEEFRNVHTHTHTRTRKYTRKIFSLHKLVVNRVDFLIKSKYATGLLPSTWRSHLCSYRGTTYRMAQKANSRSSDSALLRSAPPVSHYCAYFASFCLALFICLSTLANHSHCKISSNIKSTEFLQNIMFQSI